MVSRVNGRKSAITRIRALIPASRRTTPSSVLLTASQPSSGVLQCFRNFNCPVPVSIGLDYGHDLRFGSNGPADRREVLRDLPSRDLNPGTVWFHHAGTSLRNISSYESVTAFQLYRRSTLSIAFAPHSARSSSEISTAHCSF